MNRYVVTFRASEAPFNGTEIQDFQVPIYAESLEQAQAKAEAAADKYVQFGGKKTNRPPYTIEEVAR